MSTKGKWLTIEQKCELIAQHRREPSINYTQLSVWAKTRFELSVPPTRQTIRNIIQAATVIEAKRLRVHVTAKGRDPCVRSRMLEDQLKQYVNTCREDKVQLTRRLLNTKAREIMDGMDKAPTHNLSVGWLTRFMKRHGLCFQKDKEELTETSTAAAAQAQAGSTFTVDFMELQGPETDVERVRVDKLRQKATKRLRELEKEARELRTYLRRLDAATNAHLHL